MECVAGTVKTTFTGLKTSFSDDFTAVIGVSGDDLFVDGLLDFSDDGDFEQQNDDTHVVVDANNDKSGSVSPVKTESKAAAAAGFSSMDDRDTDLCLPVTIPADDVADLEWVSQFVDDTFSGGYSLTCPAGNFSKSEPEKEPETLVTPTFTTPVVTKARTKRGRTGGRVWPVGTGQPADSSASSSSSSSFTNTWLLFNDSVQTAESGAGRFKLKPAVKRQKKGNPGTVQPRRCSHCLVQKTPQWRTGPLGAKTLCNACGVRYKSGRLLPEYRPACSPTFSSEVHSNSHRKVLEMRQKKEEADVGMFLPVRSF